MALVVALDGRPPATRPIPGSLRDVHANQAKTLMATSMMNAVNP
jgi:hypothetical protein